MSTGTAVLLDSKALSVGVPVSEERRECRDCYVKREMMDAGILGDASDKSAALFILLEKADLLFNAPNPHVSICTKCRKGRPEAILPSVLIPVDGTYRVRTFALGHVSDPEGRHEGFDFELGKDLFEEVDLYIGHPRKRSFAEKLGAVVVSKELFPGLETGECAIVLSVKKDRVDRLLTSSSGYLSRCGGVDIPRDLTLDDMELKIIERLE